jgi:hypothetical protein
MHGGYCLVFLTEGNLASSNWRKSTVMRIVIVVGATLTVITAAGAADIPRPQPVYQQAQVGKMPIGKTPVGKTPIGKTPRPYARY